MQKAKIRKKCLKFLALCAMHEFLMLHKNCDVNFMHYLYGYEPNFLIKKNIFSILNSSAPYMKKNQAKN